MTESIIVDSTKNLFVYSNEENCYIDWNYVITKIHKYDISKFYEEGSFYGDIEVLNLKKNGVNYKATIEFMSTLTNISNIWVLLLNKDGNILKKSRIDI
jgi:hypothetical protein